MSKQEYEKVTIPVTKNKKNNNKKIISFLLRGRSNYSPNFKFF